MWTYLCRGHRWGLVEKLLSSFQLSNSDFLIFQLHFTNRRQSFRVVSKQKYGELESTRISQKVCNLRLWAVQCSLFSTRKLLFSYCKQLLGLVQTNTSLFLRRFKSQCATPFFTWYCELQVAPRNWAVLEVKSNVVKHRQSFLDRLKIKQTKTVEGYYLEVHEQNLHYHERRCLRHLPSSCWAPDLHGCVQASFHQQQSRAGEISWSLL